GVGTTDEMCSIYDVSRIHWCAKIERRSRKLAYQLNEEAERQKDQIRRLSGGGCTVAHAQICR
ncbi:hypothetical protein TNCV_4540191, partial [Trichonephila clavipes]